MSATYAVSEYFRWHWKKDEPPANSALFHLVYMVFLALALVIVVSGLDPVQVTETAMVFNAVALPFTLFPLLLVASDPQFVDPSLVNGPMIHLVGWLGFGLLTLVALAGLLLYILTGGGG